MASALGSPALVAGNAAAAQWSGPEVSRQLGKIGQAGAVNQVAIVASLRSSRKRLCTKSRMLVGRSSGKSSVMVRADFVSNETSGPGVGETVSLRDVASDSEGGVGDSAVLRDISSEAAAEGGQTPELHKTAKDKAEHSPLQESVEDIEAKAEEVSSAVTQDSADKIGDERSELEKKREGGRPLAFHDVELTEKDLRDVSSEAAAEGGSYPDLHRTAKDKSGHSYSGETVEDVEGKAEELSVENTAKGAGKAANGSLGLDLSSPKSTSGSQASGDEAELPTTQEIGAEIMETIKDGIEQLRWSAESMMTSGGYARKGFEAAKEAIDKRLRGLSVAAEEVREMGAQAAEIAQKGWGGFSEKVEVIQKEVSSLTEELQSSSDDLSKRAADGSEKSRSQILQTLNQAEERARAVGSQVTEAARQLGEQANEQGTKLSESAEKIVRDIQEQAKQVGDAVGEAAQNVQNRGSRVSESSGNIVREAENLTKDLGKGGESEPNSQENFAERLQNQGNKVSTATGNVVRESEDLWRDLLSSEKHRDVDQQGSPSRSSAHRNDQDADGTMKNEYEDEQPLNIGNTSPHRDDM